jgi:sulfatase modifying factor 1
MDTTFRVFSATFLRRHGAGPIFFRLRRLRALKSLPWDTCPMRDPFAPSRSRSSRQGRATNRGLRGNRTKRLAVAFVLLAASGCGGRTSGSNSAASCTDNGTVHADSATWTCSDGCNTCACSNGKIVSTQLACLRPEGGAASDAGLDVTTGAEAEAGNDATGVADVTTTNVDANDSAVEASGDAEPEAGVDAALPPSCAPGGPGMTNCGPGGMGTESCCTSLPVPGGTYNRTYTNPGTGATGLANPATVSGFRMDKYLVTVGRFRQFVNAWNGGNGYTPPAGSGKHTHLNSGNGLAATGGGFEPGWDATDWNNTTDVDPTTVNLTSCISYSTWTASPGSQENLPITCVNWWESYAFCIWDGGFLPSEAEWEYAAAGGGQQREYPWGSTDPGTANQYAIYDCNYPNGSGSCAWVANIAPVGTATLGAGLWGQLDMAGDEWEWNLDWYAPPYTVCTDCAQFTVTSARVFRGGTFSFGASYLLPAFRYYGPPAGRSNYIGFRCSRTP